MAIKDELPENLHIVKGPPRAAVEFVAISLGQARWLSNPKAWDRDEFVTEVEQAMREVHGEAVELDRLLIGLLCSQAEIYVQCWHDIRAQGLTITFNSGQTPGKNPCVAIADRALKQVVTILAELGLAPKNRRYAKVKGRYGKLLAGP